MVMSHMRLEQLRQIDLNLLIIFAGDCRGEKRHQSVRPAIP
jgi:hypothetical protein